MRGLWVSSYGPASKFRNITITPELQAVHIVIYQQKEKT